MSNHSNPINKKASHRRTKKRAKSRAIPHASHEAVTYRKAMDAWRRSPARKATAWTLLLVGLFALLQPTTAQPQGPGTSNYSSLAQLNTPAPSAPLTESRPMAPPPGTPPLPGNVPGSLPSAPPSGANVPGPVDNATLSLIPSSIDPQEMTSPEGLTSTLQIMLLLTVLTLAPAIIMMTTSFVRIVVVLGLLRQAIGTQQLPPSQVITSLALFVTLLIMAPVWTDVYDNAIEPYTSNQITLEQAFERGQAPVREFMSMQIERTGNTEDVWMFIDYIPDCPEPTSYDEVPWRALLPAFMLSELKTAFLIGFQIYLPFLILDMVIASVMVSMGMLMLPPVIISLPFKLMLFVLLDGWHLVVGMLLESFAFYT